MLWVVDGLNKFWKEDNDHNNLLGVTWHYVEILKETYFEWFMNLSIVLNVLECSF